MGRSNQMPEYRVTWEIDVDAENPTEAARLAEATYVKTEGCRVYEVALWDGLDLRDPRVVDLDLEDKQ